MRTGWEPLLFPRRWKRSTRGATASRLSRRAPSCAPPASRAPCSFSPRPGTTCSTATASSGSRQHWETAAPWPTGSPVARGGGHSTSRSIPGWVAPACAGTKSSRSPTSSTRRISRAATPSSTRPSATMAPPSSSSSVSGWRWGAWRGPALLHVANSAAALKGGSFAFDAVRPGVYLYGGSPGVGLPEGKPVVSVRARVVAVRRVRAGDSVSYNASWTATRDTTIATLGIGYADGLRRSLGRSGQARVLLGGRLCPIIGLVTMDLTMVDVGDGSAAVGDIATLVGSAAEGGTITLEQFAAWSGALQREFLTGLGGRLPRIYR